MYIRNDPRLKYIEDPTSLSNLPPTHSLTSIPVYVLNVSGAYELGNLNLGLRMQQRAMFLQETCQHTVKIIMNRCSEESKSLLPYIQNLLSYNNSLPSLKGTHLLQPIVDTDTSVRYQPQL